MVATMSSSDYPIADALTSISTDNQIRTVPYSKFVESLNDGMVTSIHVKEDKIFYSTLNNDLFFSIGPVNDEIIGKANTNGFATISFAPSQENLRPGSSGNIFTMILVFFLMGGLLYYAAKKNAGCKWFRQWPNEFW